MLASDGRSVVLAADHRARGILTVERYAEYVGALRAAAPFCDALMSTAQPLEDLVRTGALRPDQGALLSINRTGLAGTVFELDDRLVASCERAASEGYAGVKIMTRIDRSDPVSSGALELLGQVLEQARAVGITCLVEPLSWVDGGIDRRVEGIVWAAAIAGDMGAPLLKVPIPAVPPGDERVDAVRRVVECVGVPVLFLGGPRKDDSSGVLGEIRDAMTGGAAGLAIGRSLYQDPDPAGMARRVAELVHGRAEQSTG